MHLTQSPRRSKRQLVRTRKRHQETAPKNDPQKMACHSNQPQHSQWAWKNQRARRPHLFETRPL